MRKKQRVAIKFCFETDISATETLSMLQKAYGDDSLKCITVLEWYGRFHDDRESIENNKCCMTSKPFDTLPKIHKLYSFSTSTGI